MKTATYFLLSICCLVALLATSCKGKVIEGDGKIITHEIPVDIYNEIKVEGAIDVIYEAKPDEAAYLRAEADDNIIPLIDVRTKGRILQIKVKESINPSRLTIYTNSPSLKFVESKGASNITLKGAVAGSDLKIEMKGTGNFGADNLIYEKAQFKLSGAGHMLIAGQIHKAKLEISGSGNIESEELAVDELECNIKGNGDVKVNAIEKLSIDISGRGNLAYKGNPQITKQKIKGAGTVSVLP